jgi:threonine/homoserine/homoserine lactone efflux protein
VLLALVLGLLCGFIGSIPIAGPVAVLVVERALGGRAREGLALAAGAAIAEGVYAGLAFLGMTAALARFPWLLPVSRVLGAVILVALGLYFAFRKSKPAGQDEEKKDKKRGRRGGPFVLGLVVTMVNPTLLVTWSAVVTVIHGSMRVQESAGDAPFFGLGAMSGILSWFTLFTALLQRFREKMGPRTLDKVVRGIGWTLVAVGLVLGVKVGLQWRLGH